MAKHIESTPSVQRFGLSLESRRGQETTAEVREERGDSK